MEPKKFTQFGTATILILTPLLLVFAVLFIKTGMSLKPESIVHLILVISFFICLLIFYKLTIVVDRTFFTFKLGIGLVKKTYKLTDIESCKPVKNHFLYGLGIHTIPNGWLYNVSGLNAIELRFKNKKWAVRIGTDKPEEINTLIQSYLVSTR